MKSGNKNKGPAHNRFRHGMTGSSTYQTWAAMKARCMRPTSGDYKNYGARGISICPEWLDFLTFLRDMGERPNHAMTLERLDTNGDYCPGNCVWADRTAQSRNRRYVKASPDVGKLVRKGRSEGKTNRELSEQFGLSMTHIIRIARGVSWV